MSSSARSLRAGTIAAAVAVCGALCVAPVGAQAGPRAHALGTVEATSRDLFTTVSNVRALPGGRLLVLDLNGRKLVLVEPDLASWKVVADTTGATGNAFSGRIAGLIAYRGDSSLFVDPIALTMLVLDARGEVARVMAIPRPNDGNALTGGQNGFPGFDAQGRLVYRGPPGATPRPPCNADGTRPIPSLPDHAPLVRIDPTTRVVDTITMLKTSRQIMKVSTFPVMSMSVFQSPMPQADDWTVLPNGTVAVVRAVDYHVDYYDADGSTRSASKVPFGWMHLTDSAKSAYVDSTRAVAERRVPPRPVEILNEVQTGNFPIEMSGSCDNAAPTRVGTPIAVPAPPGVFERAVGGTSSGRGSAGGRGPVSTTPTVERPPVPVYIAGAVFLPDYAPAFSPGAVRSDFDGNLWVRTSVVMGGGSVYDVIDAKGELVDRLIAPPGRVIAGFGPAGAVYMGVREGAGTRLELARRVTTRP